MADSRIAILFTLLEGAIPSRRTEEFLRYGFKMGHNREARAAAGLALAKYLHYRDQYERRSLRLLKQKEIRNAFDRHWKLVITPHLQKLPYDKDESIAEIERLLQAVASDYANVESSGWRFYGPGKILLERVPQPRRETYGALARALTNERTRVAPGQRAIEIFGRDSESKRFRLSDYEGKAVLLTFSADWCVSCKELYPIKRKLIERFKGKPFVVLSVSRDVKIETLKASRSSGEITWRCWWDGLEGPIADSWHVASAPAIFLLNADHVIEDIELLPTSSFEDYEQAISIALGKPQG
ncbi:MAG: TlpA disulfide reductase family protein [Planctomycetota bacterium]